MAKSWSSEPPIAGSGSGRKPFPPPSKGGPTKTLHSKSERMTVSCRVTGACLKRLICKSTNYDTTEKEKSVCNVAGQRDPFRHPRHGNLYRLLTPPPISSSLVKMTTLLSIVQRLGSSGALLPLPYTPSPRAQGQFHLNIFVLYLRRTRMDFVRTRVNQILVYLTFFPIYELAKMT